MEEVPVDGGRSEEDGSMVAADFRDGECLSGGNAHRSTMKTEKSPAFESSLMR